MAKYALFANDGLPRGFYTDDVSGPIMLPVYGAVPEPTEDDTQPIAPVIGEAPNPAYPAGVVAISEAQWLDFVANPGLRRWNGADVEAYEPPAVALVVPDNPTLSDWRVGLTLWKRDDGTLRIDEVTDKVAALVKAGNPMGRIARERLEYANTVIRAQLMQLAGALGFSEAEIDQSLWRADRVRQGDLSGMWPLPAEKGAAA